MHRGLSAYLSGLLVANAAPHLATAASGREHLTPLAGRNSGPRVNAVWGGLNLAGGMALLAVGSRRGPRPTARWGRELHWFEAGYLTFAAWMTLSERVLGTNTTAAD